MKYFIASSADVSSIASFPVHDVDTSIDLKELKNQLAQLIKSKGPDLIQVCMFRFIFPPPQYYFSVISAIACLSIVICSYVSITLPVKFSNRKDLVNF